MDTKNFEKKMEAISPFELKNQLIDMADESLKKTARTMLNAGRGNPNWIATTPREAFFLLGQFGLEECRRVMNLPEGIAGIPQKEGIASRFEAFLKKNNAAHGTKLLEQTYNYLLMQHAADPDSLVHEWAEAVIGDQYPVPDRILHFTEILVQDYLSQEMCDNRPPRGTFDLFATEGGTAAMCYLFDSLQENFLLDKGDGIALMVPAFTPYIEIPQLSRYQFNMIELHADLMTDDGFHLWQYNDKDIDRLKDPAIKALFVTNPSNPPSYALSPETMARIVNIVKNDNPNLMVITDDVYGTFSPHFRSFMAELPHNTLCVYSFSKYFGATGWRDAVIALHEDNIYDKQIARLPEDKRNALNRRYSSLTLHPEKMKFIDRMVADSRQVALNHTAGLSLPQQMQMSLFASFALLDKENKYKLKMMEIIEKRLHALWDNTGFTLIKDPLRVGYYTEIDMLVWAKKFYGDDFVEYLKRTYSPLNVVFRLAKETSLVLLNGGGFDGPEWSIRASLANLNERTMWSSARASSGFLTNTQRRGKRLRKNNAEPCQPITIRTQRERTPMTGKHLANKHQTDSLPVRFSGKEGTEELCFSLFCYTGAIIYHFNRGRSDCTDYTLPCWIVPSGACSMLSAAFLIIFTNTCSKSAASKRTGSNFGSHSSQRRIFRSLHIPSIKRLHMEASSFSLPVTKAGSGIFTTSAKRVIKRLIEKQRSVQTRITSQISSISSSVERACSTVSRVDVIPAVVLFTSCAIMRITFSYAFFSARITSSVIFSIR